MKTAALTLMLSLITLTVCLKGLLSSIKTLKRLRKLQGKLAIMGEEMDIRQEAAKEKREEWRTTFESKYQ